MQNVHEGSETDAKNEEIDVFVLVVNNISSNMESVDFTFVGDSPSIIQKIYMV